MQLASHCMCDVISMNLLSPFRTPADNNVGTTPRFLHKAMRQTPLLEFRQ
jgi:hypothetical protein